MSTRLFTLTLAFLALAGIAQAVLPVPEVQYDRTIPGLALAFTVEGFFPPAGSVAWEVTLERDGQTSTFLVPGVNREVFVYTPPLRPGTYFITAAILDVDEEVIDYCPKFDWLLDTPLYRAVIPHVALGGEERWDTGLALAIHDVEEAVHVKVVLYNAAGEWVFTENFDLEPNASHAFNFSHYVSRPDPETDPNWIFTGSASVICRYPVAMTYQCRPYNPDTKAPGIAFGMVLARDE